MVSFGFIGCAVNSVHVAALNFLKASRQDEQTEHGTELLLLEEGWKWDGVWDDSLGDLGLSSSPM